MTEFAIPVSKIRRARSVPKGRPIDPVARADVASLLEGASLARDHLIENLHRVQDRFGCLSAAHLNALAEAMKLSQAEVGSSRVDLQACKLEYSIVSPK